MISGRRHKWPLDLGTFTTYECLCERPTNCGAGNNDGRHRSGSIERKKWARQMMTTHRRVSCEFWGFTALVLSSRRHWCQSSADFFLFFFVSIVMVILWSSWCITPLRHSVPSPIILENVEWGRLYALSKLSDGKGRLCPEFKRENDCPFPIHLSILALGVKLADVPASFCSRQKSA